MRVLAVLAHDNPESLNTYFFNEIVNDLKKNNIEVDVLDLYQRADEIPFFTVDRKKLEANKFYQENRERFMAADRLLIVFPVYWYSGPGILKCWIDLITNFAYRYTGGTRAKALHKIQSAFVINTSTAPVWFRKIITGDLSCRQLCEFFKWIGIKRSGFYRIGVKNMTDDKVQYHLKSILPFLYKVYK